MKFEEQFPSLNKCGYKIESVGKFEDNSGTPVIKERKLFVDLDIQNNCLDKNKTIKIIKTKFKKFDYERNELLDEIIGELNGI